MPQAGSGAMRASVTAGPPRHLLTSLLSPQGSGTSAEGGFLPRPAGSTAPLWMWPDWGPHGAATMGVAPGCVRSNPAPPAEAGQSHVGGRWAPGPTSRGPASHAATPRPGRKLGQAPGWAPHPAGPRDVTGHPGAGHGDGQEPPGLAQHWDTSGWQGGRASGTGILGVAAESSAPSLPV